jgi:hypothetical protein
MTDLITQEEIASDAVAAASDRRDDAVDAVLGACIHTLSDAIQELDAATVEWHEALEVWSVAHDRLKGGTENAHTIQ